MPPTRFACRRRFALLAAVFVSLLFTACSTPGTRSAGNTPLVLAAPVRPAGVDVLPRWREHFDALQQALISIDQTLVELESADAPAPQISEAKIAPALALLGHFALAPGETLLLPTVHGPETPFPDHQPLRQVAGLRTVQARRALAAGDKAQALALVRENLVQARATLASEAGLIPLIHAVAVWQCALDGVHALARSPALNEAEARALLSELEADRGLARMTLDRALRGEYHHVYRVIVERMPQTDDPDLALSSVGSLGMAPPESLAPGEIGLGLTKHTLLDPAATLAAYEADLAPYLAALSTSPRLPRGIYDRVTAPVLIDYRKELGAFYDYAGGDAATDLSLLVRARQAMESTTNPIGKLLAVYLTPPWEMMMASVFRREAQRSALCALLAWRIHGCPAQWEELVAAGLLDSPPADPFSDGALRYELGDSARIWSVYLNGQDDGGVPVEGNNGQPDDLVWIR